VLVGFAAESGDPLEKGREKLRRKSADLIVANDISRTDAGFDSELNAATIIGRGHEEQFPLGPKTLLAARILDRAEKLLEARVEK
jgi:phosphopantothenoylcysteine decarboxylase/phosphopantothenate--cysteine ligase